AERVEAGAERLRAGRLVAIQAGEVQAPRQVPDAVRAQRMPREVRRASEVELDVERVEQVVAVPRTADAGVVAEEHQRVDQRRLEVVPVAARDRRREDQVFGM